ncbi:hypothetical protein DY000_02053761 [Brassica cretica]|uniref:Uncharacterized protein n=1 Tax=Brassica cretica TaxID=69181 RepID=A0ABQ7AA72_BRACR|nr:hypothetical protein DY000_02053761 [Brassica cretica]
MMFPHVSTCFLERGRLSTQYRNLITACALLGLNRNEANKLLPYKVGLNRNASLPTEKGRFLGKSGQQRRIHFSSGGGISKKRIYGGGKKTERSSTGGSTKKRSSGGSLSQREEEPVGGDTPLVFVGGVVENMNRHFRDLSFFQVGKHNKKGSGAGSFCPARPAIAQTAKAQPA